MVEAHATQSLDIAVIGGDGIGPEVVAEALKVLPRSRPTADPRSRPPSTTSGARRWHATGETLPDSVLEEIRGHDAILLGAVGDPGVPPRRPRARAAAAAALRARPLRQPAPVAALPRRRHARWPTPGEVDFVVVREGTEGPYTGNGGALRVGTPHEVATEVSVNTAYGVERVVRDAFARAQRRGRARSSRWCTRPTCSSHAGRPVVAHRRRGRRRSSPTSRVDYLHVDAATIFLVTDPARFDVIVTDNLFGDILTDLAAAVTGGIGLAASGNINPDRTAPCMFEPVHGSAPDIAGQQQGRPDRRDPVRRRCCSTTSASTTPPRASRPRSSPTSPRARPAPPARTAEVGDAIAARVAG